MDTLKREIVKARVLVQNFAPQLLTTADLAVASDDGDASSIPNSFH
jgi:hypothetical protein